MNKEELREDITQQLFALVDAVMLRIVDYDCRAEADEIIAKVLDAVDAKIDTVSVTYGKSMKTAVVYRVELLEAINQLRGDDAKTKG